jgi:hypothetical protein
MFGGKGMWSTDYYNFIPRPIMSVLTHLEVMDKFQLPRALDLIKRCERAIFIKIASEIVYRPDYRWDIPASVFRLSSLNALILSLPSMGHQIFKYLDLPNLRLLGVTIPAQTSDQYIL